MLQALRSTFARLFSYSALYVSLFVTFIYFLSAGRPMLADPDIWWHLRNAQILIHDHAWIRADSYTFTVGGKPWINPEWLSELAYYLAWHLFSYRGIELLAIAMVLAVVMGVCWLSWLRSKNIKAALLACVLFLPMVSVSIGPRTLMFGWLCLIALLALLWEFRQGRDWLWCAPILFVVWINTHGSWPIGIVLLSVYLVTGLFEASWGNIQAKAWTPGQRNKLLYVLGLSIAALFLNPYGGHLVAYPFHITFGHRLTVNTVQEWQTLNFHTLRGKLVFFIVAALVILNMARKRIWQLYELLFLLIAILAAFTYTRFLIMAGLILCPLYACEFTFFGVQNKQDDKPILNFSIMAILAGIILTHIPTQSDIQQQIAQTYPQDAVAYLKTNKLDGHLMNDFSWGGYLEWTDPSLPVFIDTRADVFDQWGVLKDYLDATSIKQSVEILDKYHIRYVLFPKEAPIVYLLTHAQDWTMKYEDANSILLQRKQAY